MITGTLLDLLTTGLQQSGTRRADHRSVISDEREIKPSTMSLAPRTPQANNKPVLDKRHEVQEAGLDSTCIHPVTVLLRERPCYRSRRTTERYRLKNRSGIELL